MISWRRGYTSSDCTQEDLAKIMVPKGPAPGASLPASERVPEYIHKILDAFLDGEPLDFSGTHVPIEVQARLMEAVASGKLIDVPGGMIRGLG